jgi:lipopolysaccharide transport system ATP-binding protein
MAQPIIEIAGLSKKYRIGARERANRTFREAIADAFMAPVRNLRDLRKLTKLERENPEENTIWALKDVSFTVQPGEVVGIVGRNGAGKSTLLKILSRVTEPTAGEISLYGRVSSLLEIGTGFHQELTGRENIYLNGAILGMRKAEIDTKFDAIVEFSGISTFLDTPVKRYSSGMYVRLAFAVAAHLDSDILVVDEVLAVGDAAFQKKCLGTMQDISSKEGRTVLFVSHNMPSVRKFCTRGILLESGMVALDGEVNGVVTSYLESGSSTTSFVAFPRTEQPGNHSLKIASVGLRDGSGEETPLVNISEGIQVEISYEVVRDKTIPQFSLSLMDAEGNCVFSSLNNREEHLYGSRLPKGFYRSTCAIPGDLLNAGRYFVSIAGFADNWSDGFRIDNILSFDALDDGILKGDYHGDYSGCIRPALRWTTVQGQTEAEEKARED